ncbi:hypothetical protein COY27_03935 [Candidatus Woesearchaeota archaeon CG_4_10_14_0_2_um_filter_33_13]|nr:MAG: hypothetical protein COY27_03935 [Candidatus Woesearchaeota archaeon CG_4_10_14_0_2_um_filter_33_13]
MPVKDPKAMIKVFPDFQPMRIKYKDVFDLKGFYEALHEWLLENNWKDKETKPLDYWENYYGERIAQNGMREIWIQWRVWKPSDSEKLDYYLDMDWHCIAISNTEIVRDGRKIKLNKGEVELKIRVYIDKTYEKEFSQNSFLKAISSLFTKKIYREELERSEKELYQEAYAFSNFIKQWFKLKRYLPYEESKPFFTSQAFPSHLKE